MKQRGILQRSLLILIILTLNGCLVGAMLFGGAAAIVINEGFVAEDTYGGVIKSTTGKAFNASIDVMDELCHQITLDKAFRKVTGAWCGADVEVTVQNHSKGKVTIYVKARKYMLASKEIAMEVFNKILVRIKDTQ